MKELIEKLDYMLSIGQIRREKNTLHINMEVFDQTCMCGMASDTSQLKSLVVAIKNVFGVSKVVFHHPKRKRAEAAVVVVEQNTLRDIHRLPGAYKGDRLCGTYPVIRGLSMKWVFADEEPKNEIFVS